MNSGIISKHRKAILVVGMHRSGTSAVTRMMNMLGAELSGELLGSNASNELGHWESEEIIGLHDAMLKSAGSIWNDVFGIDPDWFRTEAAKGFRKSITAFLNERFSEAKIFAIKDPRLALFVPIWTEALSEFGLRPRCVIPYRNPLEVAASLASRAERFASAEFWPTGRGLLLWLRYVLAAERSTRGLRRTFVNFDSLLSDWEGEAARLADQLDVVWPSYDDLSTRAEVTRFLNQEHKHERVSDSEAVIARTSPWCWRVLRQLHACAHSPSAGARVFDEAAQTLESSSLLFKDYVSALVSEVEGLSRRNGEIFEMAASARTEILYLAEDAQRRAAEIEELAEAARAEATRCGLEAERLASIEAGAEAASTEARRVEIEALTRHIETSLSTPIAKLLSLPRVVSTRLRHARWRFRASSERTTAPPRNAGRARVVDFISAEIKARAADAERIGKVWEKARSERLAFEPSAEDVGRRASEAEAMAVAIRAEAVRFAELCTAVKPESQFASQAEFVLASRLAEEAEAVKAEASRRARDEARRAAQAEGMAVAIRQEAAEAEALRAAIRTVPYAGLTPPPGVGSQDEYARWVRLYDTVTEGDRTAIRAAAAGMTYRPRFSILMTVYNTPESLLRASVASVLAQLYPDWELWIVDDASSDSVIIDVLAELGRADGRVKWTRLAESGGVSRCANSALSMAKGEFTAFLAPEDVLAEQALYEIAAKLNQTPDADIIYSDEDRIDDTGTRHDPFFKTDWNSELLLCCNYLGQFCVYRTSVIEDADNLRVGFEASYDYDLLLRASRATVADRIRHIPAILYHRRGQPGRMAYAEALLERSLVAARVAIAEHLKALGESASVEAHDIIPFWHRVRRRLPADPPTVTVVVPTRDRPDLIRRCVDGLLRRTDYPSLDVLIVNHETTDADALALLQGFNSDARVSIIPYEGAFNYSAINNMAVEQARGEFVVLLNNDVDVIEPAWLTEMMSLAVLPDVGAVGAKLLYPDAHVQHAGVILGAAEIAGHYFHRLKRDQPGYQGRAVMPSVVSAVTAACLLVRKAIYDEVGGFDEINLPVVYNDVDFCLKLLRRGYRNIWTPYAELYHHESASRGTDTRPDQAERLGREKRHMIETWGPLLACDPFYNPNFSLTEANFTLAFPPRIKKSWVTPLCVEHDLVSVRTS